ncbi:hypothetical protein DL89DRAFT_27376 [Linderina pennispora]|uniref:Uncharacterized protein n=1 Tax=Linderina pennispora TaxID=61395 RepID=A0A1Y1W4P4_9FUNG|nr:uncharacterized protein DL89DRAFT_27376 [Linderina pennispora]ORX68154.1 hypothetical protein DL89DRAFT_27376 [Linderina pennispora]
MRRENERYSICKANGHYLRGDGGPCGRCAAADWLHKHKLHLLFANGRKDKVVLTTTLKRAAKSKPGHALLVSFFLQHTLSFAQKVGRRHFVACTTYIAERVGDQRRGSAWMCLLAFEACTCIMHIGWSLAWSPGHLSACCPIHRWYPLSAPQCPYMCLHLLEALVLDKEQARLWPFHCYSAVVTTIQCVV